MSDFEPARKGLQLLLPGAQLGVQKNHDWHSYMLTASLTIRSRMEVTEEYVGRAYDLEIVGDSLGRAIQSEMFKQVPDLIESAVSERAYKLLNEWGAK